MEKSIVQLNSSNFDTEISDTENLIVINCYATWCPVCNMVTPVFKQLFDRYNKYKTKFCEFNVEDVPKLIETYKIEAVPTILIVSNKEIKERIIGLKTKDFYQAKLDMFLDEEIEAEPDTDIKKTDDKNYATRCIDFDNNW